MAKDDDPFSDDGEHTIIKPRPGGKRGADPTIAAPSAQPPAAPPPASGPVSLPSATVPGASPLVDAASSLLSLGVQMRNTVSHPNPGELLAHVSAEIRRFEDTARSRGVSQEDVLVARYCLCTFLDEAALSTPWGAEGLWSSQSLLSAFHNETWGGEKFFEVLDRLEREPATRLPLLELLHVCLLLGFEGKYRVAERGHSKLADVRDEVGRAIRAQHGEFERELSPHWQGAGDIGVPLARYVPVWVVAAASALLLLLLYLGYSLTLTGESDPVYSEVRRLGTTVPDPERAVTVETVVWEPEEPEQLDLAGFLAPEIAAREVEVIDEPGKTTITIPGAGLFGSGSAVLDRRRVDLMERIGAALNTEPGRVLVTGHTDSDPIPGGLRLKFASNWELSQQRAEAVADLLATIVKDPTRLLADGRADTEPVAPNDSRENKGRNRRVEILLLPQGRGA